MITAGSDATDAAIDDSAPTAGSTKLTGGSVPAWQSWKNLLIGA